jgi:hypothetical protein
MENLKLTVGWIIAIAVAIVLILALSLGGCSVVRGFGRSQARADANNQVQITTINIRRAQQQARVTAAQDATVKAQAYQRYLGSVGIREAQNEISSTLTPLYVQWEAIQAEEDIATSGQNNTVVYVPSGNAGVPLITANAGTGK